MATEAVADIKQRMDAADIKEHMEHASEIKQHMVATGAKERMDASDANERMDASDAKERMDEGGGCDRPAAVAAPRRSRRSRKRAASGQRRPLTVDTSGANIGDARGPPTDASEDPPLNANSLHDNDDGHAADFGSPGSSAAAGTHAGGGGGGGGKRRKRRRRQKKANFKPYYKLTTEEKRALQEKERARAERKAAAIRARGASMAPYNTTQFLMDDLAARRDEMDESAALADAHDHLQQSARRRDRTVSETLPLLTGVGGTTGGAPVASDIGLMPLPFGTILGSLLTAAFGSLYSVYDCGAGSETGSWHSAPQHGRALNNNTSTAVGDDSSDSFEREFELEYDAVHSRRLERMRKEELVAEFVRLEDELQTARRTIDALRRDNARLRLSVALKRDVDRLPAAGTDDQHQQQHVHNHRQQAGDSPPPRSA